jgi:hypothetical protein
MFYHGILHQHRSSPEVHSRLTANSAFGFTLFLTPNVRIKSALGNKVLERPSHDPEMTG